MCILCIIIPVLVGIICAILAYFLGRQAEKKSEVYTKLRNDLENSRRAKEQLQTENLNLKNELDELSKKSSTVQHDFDAALAAEAFGEEITENDLKIIEGIGPKIEELFQNNGIKTWKDLSEATVEKCQELLAEAGTSFKAHDPTTWPLQAEMAYTGKWKELKKWQDDMLGGKL